VGVNHSRADVVVAEKLLDHSNIVPRF
jgi:hypothetical protein